MPGFSDHDTYKRWDNTFRDQREETRFLVENWPRHAKRIRITALLSGLAYLGGLHADFLALGHSSEFLVLLIARCLFFAVGLLCFGITYTRFGRALVHKVAFLYLLVIIATECIEMIFKPELGTQDLPFLAIVILVYYIFYPSRLTTLTIGGLIGSAAYVLVQGFVIKHSMVYMSTTAITFVLVNLLGVYFVHAMNRAQRTEYRALAEQRELNEKLHSEIAERKKVELKLLEMATIDELTQVFNRRHFLELAGNEFRRADRTNRPFSLLMIDVDLFKLVNDTYGHDIGDLVLKSMAETCRKQIRDVDIFGRMGGEEFALLLPETDRAQAWHMAERLRRLITDTPVFAAGGSIRITISIGVASTEEKETDTLEKLFKNADRALYRAKENGRNQVALWGDAGSFTFDHGRN